MKWAPPFFILLAFTCMTGCDDPEVILEQPDEETGEASVKWDTGEDTDSSKGEDTDDDYDGCEEISLDIKGPDSPTVGDEWFLIMRCDNAVIQGPMVVRFTPPGFANSDGKTVFFTKSGDASMRVQAGAYRVDRDIVVRP